MERLCGFGLLAAVAIACGCTSTTGGHAAAQSTASSRTANGGTTCVMHAGGRDVLRVSMPADTECKSEDGSLQIRSRDGYAYVWLVRGAKSVDDAVGQVPDVIKS